MKLVSLYINGFGKLCDFSLDFDEKLTCISQQNGYGKTTLAAFVKAMFYSLPTARKGQTPESNQRIKYLPWNTQNFGGRLTFSLGGKTYTIIRIFDRQSAINDTFQLIDAVSGKPSLDFSSKIGEEIFGVDEEGFFRSTFSDGNPTLSTLPASIRTRISSENENAQDIGQFGAAKKKLDDAIKQINGRNGSLYKLDSKVAECKNELERCKIDIEEYNRTNAQIAEINNELNRLQTQKTELDKKLSKSAGAEASRVKLENYNKLKEEIESLSNSVADIEKRYGGKLPTDSEIEEISAKIKQFEDKKVLLQSEIARTQDNEFAEILDKFKDNLPSDLSVQELSENAKIIELAQNKIDELSVKVKNFTSDLEAMHIENIDKIPTDAELYELRLTASRMPVANQGATQAKSSVLPMILAGILALVGVGIAFVNFTLGLVIAAVFAVVLVALLLLHSVKKTVSMSTSASAVSSESIKKVHQFLSTFGFSSEIDINVAIDKLKIAANLISQIDDAKAEINAQTNKLNTAKTYVDAILNEYKTNSAELLIKQREKYIEIVSPSLDKINNLKSQINELSLLLVSALKNIGVTDVTDTDFSLVLETVKKDTNEHKLSLKQLGVKTAEAEESLEKDGINEINLEETLEPLEKISSDIKALELRINELFEKRANLESKAKNLSQSKEEYNTLSSELENCRELEAEDRRKLLVFEKTLEFLNSAKITMTQKYAVRVEESFKKYSHKFLLDKAPDISVSPELELSVKNGLVARETDFFSSGERAVLDVCLRLALVDVMFEKEKPFVILDDPFSLMDKENLSDALSLVKDAAEDKQIIYFTCHPSREIK